jgi:hypothetical protein
MGKQSLFDKANQLVEYARNEKNPVIRGLLLNMAIKYYGADSSKALHEKPDLLWGSIYSSRYWHNFKDARRYH